MSWELTGLVSRKKWGGQTRRLLALTMADKANDDGSGIYASVRTMARDSEISESTARRTLQEFHQQGLIKLVGQRACANGYTNIYEMCVGAVTALPDLKPATSAATSRKVKGVSQGQGCQAEATPVTATPDGCQPDTATPVTVTDKPILKPVQEPLFRGSEKDPPKDAKAKRRKKARTEYTSEFEAFWRSWPKTWRERSDKQLAFKRWKDDIEIWEPALIMRAAARHITSSKREAYRYCGRADVFLNGKLEAAIEAVSEAVAGGGAEVWDDSSKSWVLA